VKVEKPGNKQTRPDQNCQDPGDTSLEFETGGRVGLEVQELQRR